MKSFVYVHMHVKIVSVTTSY